MKWHVVYVLGIVGVIAMLAGCVQLPTLEGRTSSQLIHETSDTRLGKAIEPLAKAHPGKSGIVSLSSGSEAFAARALLANVAQRTLDIQYYIWHNDISGALLFEALHRAANRGVRVRLLLDDNNTVGLDTILAALDGHPNIEVRLFNPFMHRRWRALDYLTDFGRVNRRMHNKSFTADNQVTIVGGRNVGDEYFGIGQDFLFVDLDVMAIGPVVSDVSNDFDLYWKSESSYPANRLLPAVSPELISGLTKAAAAAEANPVALAYTKALAKSLFVQQLLDGTLVFEWATTRMVSDDPAKGLGKAQTDDMLPRQLGRIFGTPQKEIQLVSPYFVPTATGVDYLAALARSGVKITVLTNALEATDVAAVHAGYAKRRKPLLEAGVVLYEMKRVSPSSSGRDRGLAGSSASSLHAKTMSVDRERIFIGSFNFDPRSARLNTEMGVVIDNPAMAQLLPDAVSGNILTGAYQVRLNELGALEWVEEHDGKIIVHTTEPGTSFWLRFGVSVLSHLPIEWML